MNELFTRPRSSKTDGPSRILLALSDGVACAAYEAALIAHSDFEIAAVATNSDSAVKSLKGMAIDVLVTDATFSKSGAIKLAQFAYRNNPGVGVVFFADGIWPQRVMGLVKTQFSGLAIVTKPMIQTLDDFTRAVHDVITGLILLDPNLAEHLAPMAAGSDARGQLTDKEEEVLAAIGEGLSNQAAAERLGLSERTVRNYVGLILHKIGERGRADHDGRVKAALYYWRSIGQIPEG